MKRVDWHRELPPIDAQQQPGGHTVEAVSRRIAGTIPAATRYGTNVSSV